jgi:hypothetical protein
MKRVKVSLAVLAVIFAAGSAFTTKAITYKNASGQTITETQYLACPNTNQVTCGIKYNNGTEVERRFFAD